MAAIEEIKAPIQEMFSADAIRWGDLIFVSGCVPCDEEGNLVGAGDLDTQVRKTMANLGAVLEAAGSDFEHVMKTTVFMTDITARRFADQARREVFGTRPPASTIVEVTALTVPGAEFEIDAIAILK